jgi:predicted aldo/keto reductase-like oxidoreductase
MMDTEEKRCTVCGYCSPCPQRITVGAALSYYNAFKYLGMESARAAFREKQWEEGLRLDLCTQCGVCESRCPNGLPVRRMIAEARSVMYT